MRKDEKMLKKEYNPPQITFIGDMYKTTLGASGTVSDSAGQQASGNGNSSNTTTTNNKNVGRTFDNSVFDKSPFDK